MRQHFPGLVATRDGPGAGAQAATGLNTVWAAADAVKGPKAKFVPNEKKTGVPTGKPSVAKPVSKKAAAKKVAQAAKTAAKKKVK